MVAHYLGAAKPKAAQQVVKRLDEQNFIPATALPSDEFDALLAAMKLPVRGATAPPHPPQAPAHE